MLKELKEYASREGLLVEPGLKPKSVRWLAVFSPQAQLLGVLPADGGDGKTGREFPACPDLTQQEMASIGSGCRHFLVDGVDVLALFTKDDKADAKLVAKHEFFVQLLEQAVDCLPELGPVVVALRDKDTLAALRIKLAEVKAKPTDLATPAIQSDAGTSIPVALSSWHTWWQERRKSLVEARKKPAAGRRKMVDGAESCQMLCLLSGQLVSPQPTHNKIEGLSAVGGLSMGDALTSFDKEAFTSFGLEQGANAAMSAAMAKTYASALNHLIKTRSRRLAGTLVVYWYSGSVEREEDPIAALLDGIDLPEAMPPPEDAPPYVGNDGLQRRRAEGQARALLDAFRSGEPPDASRFRDIRYYALTLSANSGRVVIRDWMEGPFEELLQTVAAWFDDLTIVSRDGSRVVDSHKFAAVLAAPLRDLKDATGPLVTTLWRCALKRQPIPFQMMAQTLHRVRIDAMRGDSPRHERLGLLKAFSIRQEGLPNMTSKLNEFETHPAYICGRILAILARIQYEALGDVGAGVVQRYYAAASATPALILGRLVRTAKVGHLPKIDKGLAVWFDRQLGEIWDMLHAAPPTVLTLEEQTLFAMGYYHQNANRAQRTGEKADQESVSTIS
jgi:CRISPR-associated protein Csd1